MGLKWDDTELRGNLKRFPQKMDRALTALIGLQAPRIESSMKSGASWTDRTGNARSGLFARPNVIPKRTYAIDIGHAVSYGIWLEVRWSGRYAVIQPALSKFGPETMTRAQALLSRMS